MNLKFENVQYVVFDEADQLFELGFAEQLNDILGRLPEVRQMVLFSATLPKMLVEFARAGLREPVLIRYETLEVGGMKEWSGTFCCGQYLNCRFSLFNCVGHELCLKTQSLFVN